MAPTHPQTNYPNSSPWHLRTSGFIPDETPTQTLLHSHRTVHIPLPPGLCPGCARSSSPSPPPISWTHPTHCQAPAPMPPPPRGFPSLCPSGRAPTLHSSPSWDSKPLLPGLRATGNLAFSSPAGLGAPGGLGGEDGQSGTREGHFAEGGSGRDVAVGKSVWQEQREGKANGLRENLGVGAVDKALGLSLSLAHNWVGKIRASSEPGFSSGGVV